MQYQSRFRSLTHQQARNIGATLEQTVTEVRPGTVVQGYRIDKSPAMPPRYPATRLFEVGEYGESIEFDSLQPHQTVLIQEKEWQFVDGEWRQLPFSE